jgi:CheY-like chemotaxis protein
MRAEAPEWREESDSTFIAETARVSLVVCRLADRRHARFLVMARRATGSDVSVGSGTTENVGQAMQEAEEVAQRLPNATDRIRTLVIVVDDNNAVRSAVANTLRDGGYVVAEFSSGEGALRRLERSTNLPSSLRTSILAPASADCSLPHRCVSFGPRLAFC